VTACKVAGGTLPAPARPGIGSVGRESFRVSAGFICHSYRQDEILMLIRLMEKFPSKDRHVSQHVLEGYKIADEIAQHGAGRVHFRRLVGLQIRGVRRHSL